MVNNFRFACIKKLPLLFGKEEIEEIKKSQFNPSEIDEGFSILDSFNDTIYYIQYLRKMPYTYGEYDGKYVKKTESTIKEITFELDFKSRVLIVFSGSSQADYFSRILMNRFDHKISSPEIDFLQLIDSLTNDGFIIRSEQAVINGFVYNEIMVGKYIADIKEMELLKKVIIKYNGKVEKIKLDIEDPNDNRFLLTVGKNGSFAFNSLKDENLDLLKTIISKLIQEEVINDG